MTLDYEGFGRPLFIRFCPFERNCNPANFNVVGNTSHLDTLEQRTEKEESKFPYYPWLLGSAK